MWLTIYFLYTVIIIIIIIIIITITTTTTIINDIINNNQWYDICFLESCLLAVQKFCIRSWIMSSSGRKWWMQRRLKLFSVGVHPWNAGNFCVLFLSNLAMYIQWNVLKPLYFGKFMEVPGVLMYFFLEKLCHVYTAKQVLGTWGNGDPMHFIILSTDHNLIFIYDLLWPNNVFCLLTATKENVRNRKHWLSAI